MNDSILTHPALKRRTAQKRYFAVAPRREAEAAFAALERAFDEDGFPVSIQEIDEARDLHEVSVYAESADDNVVGRFQAALPHGAAVSIDDVPDVDWVAASLRALSPVRAGRFLVHGAHDRDKRRPNDLAIEIEAGLAFGTGHHGTTSGCLAMIGQVVRRERPGNALDLGAGSAVLAIAIAKQARIEVLATDIDPVATRVAAQNARLNGVSALVATATAVGFGNPAIARRAPFDLIVANILARPLMRLAPAMARHLVLGGSVILSGILARQRNAVVSAYAGQGFRHVSTLPRAGWVAIHMKR